MRGSRIRTKSLWGEPPSRFYRLLNRTEALFDRTQSLRIAILGCADGKFVLPAARRGHFVLAIDVDSVALFGGEKPGIGGKVWMPGLVSRLEQERLRSQVRVVHGDFARDAPIRLSHLVFTSGAVQYSRNTSNPMRVMVERMKSYVTRGGLLYVDYMLPSEDKYVGRQNCPGRREWTRYFQDSAWSLIYNRVLPPVVDRAHVEYTVDHYHHWGHLLVQRRGRNR